jgi:predicted DNA-binding transcriptional regulator YafY
VRRADRLFALVQILRGRRLSTAAMLAARLQVSQRSIYRDVQDLQRSGVPILGEAGLGYQLDRDYIAQPLMFTWDELEALTIGARMISAWGDQGLAQASTSALEKIAAIVPADRRQVLEQTHVYAPSFQVSGAVRLRFEQLRRAIRARIYCSFTYKTAEEISSTRKVRPLALHFWGERWTLASWCETRQDFRSFRLDRMKQLKPLEEHFAAEAGKNLAEFFRRVAREDPGCLS